jgi:NAD(P)H-hydrate epimerase
MESSYGLISESDIHEILVPRTPFSHKGTYGHALIIAGNEETMGAALLSAGSCLFSGAGLTTGCIPSGGLGALNSLYPEVMAFLRDKHSISTLQWEKYQSIAIGPGLGVSSESKNILETTLKGSKTPLVIDADAINLISENYELMGQVPEGSMFTPHVKEFDRLFGHHANWWARLQTGMEYSKQLRCVIILKNRYTIIFTTKGECIFNPTGSPAMATGGMGDVLTGILASFLAQGYSSEEAAILATYIHGKAGEELVKEKGYSVIPAGILIKKLPKVVGSFSK